MHNVYNSKAPWNKLVWQTNMAAGPAAGMGQLDRTGSGTHSQQSGIGQGAIDQASLNSDSFTKNSSYPEAGSQASSSSDGFSHVQTSVKTEPLEQTSLQSLQELVNFNDKKPTNGNTTLNGMSEIPGGNENDILNDKKSVNNREAAGFDNGFLEDYQEESRDNKHVL